MKTLLTTIILFTFSLSTFAQRNAKSEKINYGKNIISFMPIYLITNNNIGLGLSYERLANEYVGIRVPVMLGINAEYANVGLELKLYPAKNTGPAKYAIAPMITFGTGKETYTETYWDPNRNNSYTRTFNYDRTHFGFLLNQTFNFTIMKNFYIGMDGGLGINYYDNNHNPNRINNNNNNSNNTNNLRCLAQFQVMMGARF